MNQFGWPRRLFLGLLLWLVTACVAPPIVPLTPPTPTPTPAITLETEPWWQDAIFYEIFVRSFFDSNGDGIGDFNGITAKLDYLNDGDPATTDDLGIDALWLMPIHPAASYHGYDVLDYYAVNPDYGTLEDFRQLLAAAQARGIRVIIDLVLNHTSREHEWFVQAQDPQSPRRDWYRWSASDPGGRGPWGQTVWHPTTNGDYYYGVFWDGMPDLNHENPAVLAEVDQIVRFWLEEVGVDGFRVDGARYLVEAERELADSAANHAWFRRLYGIVKASNPAALLVGEVWTSNDIVATYARGDELDLLFNFDLANAFVYSAQQQNAGDAALHLAISARLLPGPVSATFLTNHDIDRVMSQLGDDVNAAKRAATLLLTAPGTPFLYYGEEIGQIGRKPDEDIRLPFQWNHEANAGFSTVTPWRAPAADFAWKNLAAQQADASSLFAHYQALIRVRGANPALQIGAGVKVNSEHRAVLALLRASANQTLLVVTNLSESSIDSYTLTMPEGPLQAERTYQVTPIWGNGPFAQVTATATGGFAGYQPNAGLAPGETLILQLDPAR